MRPSRRDLLVRGTSSFEPFGKDFNEGTPQSAEAAGVFLRLPGQWVEQSWEDASLGAELFYNVHRWYEPGIGRYSRPDPVGLTADLNLYAYALGNPIGFFDPFGLKVCRCDRRLALPLDLNALNPLRLDRIAHHTFVEITSPGTPCGYLGMAWGLQNMGGGRGRVYPERTPTLNDKLHCREVRCIDEQKLLENIVTDMRTSHRYEAYSTTAACWNKYNCQGWADDVLDRSKKPLCCDLPGLRSVE